MAWYYKSLLCVRGAGGPQPALESGRSNVRDACEGSEPSRSRLDRAGRGRRIARGSMRRSQEDEVASANCIDVCLENIREQCKKEDAVLAAYLFGSTAVGWARAGSDIDVAVLLDEESLETFPVLEWAVRLEKACGRPVDLVILNRAGELLKYEVRRRGRLVFDRDPPRRKRFEVLGRKRFEDFLYLHRRYVSKVLYRSKG